MKKLDRETVIVWACVLLFCAGVWGLACWGLYALAVAIAGAF